MNKQQSVGFWKELNHVVFWPPFLLLITAVVLNFTNQEFFAAQLKIAQTWLLVHFGWLFSLVAMTSVLLCAAIYFSRFGQIRLGGQQAKPLMSIWNWFSITVCTTIAVGILFWSTAEPIYHFHQPPESSGIEAKSPQAITFAMSTMFLHWAFTPYSIYAVASLMFGFAYYNMQKPFSIGSMLVPIFGDRITGPIGNIIDAICLYSLVAGMSASLGTGILAISGGLNLLLGVPRGPLTWGIITLLIVATFVVSSATGLMKGIRILSDLNTRLLFGLAVVVFAIGPTIFILNLGLESTGIYLTHFFEMNLFNGTVADDTWSHSWTIFYWAVWLAWTPITACFLGRIAYGRTVREFMLVNLVLPSLFAMAWMAIFSGTALHLETMDAGLMERIEVAGDESASYAVFEALPFSIFLILFYLTSAFICYVTSADSNTSAMASISSTGISPDQPEGNFWIKLIWGCSVGAVAWIMISFFDNTEGIKIVSNLGGFPAAILVTLVIVSLIKVVLNHEHYNSIDKTDVD